MKKAFIIGATLLTGGYLYLAPQFGATTCDSVIAQEEAYFAKHGQYLQIQQGNNLPAYEKKNGEKVKDKLGADVPTDCIVDVQNGGEKKAYIISKVPPLYVASTSTPAI